MPSSYAQTAQQIIDDAFRLCLDFRGSGRDGRIWRYSEALDEFNFTLIDLAKNTGILRASYIFPIQVNVNIYDLPRNYVRPLRFVMNGDTQGRFLLPKTLTRDDLMRLPTTPKGDPTHFFKEFLPSNKIGFFPIPSQTGTPTTGMSDTTDTKGNVQMWYMRSPTPQISITDYPDSGIPEFIHMWLKYGVAARMCMYSKRKIHQQKLQRNILVWRMAVNRLKRLGMWQGPLQGVRPL